jgi:hypothetical protein
MILIRFSSICYSIGITKFQTASTIFAFEPLEVFARLLALAFKAGQSRYPAPARKKPWTARVFPGPVLFISGHLVFAGVHFGCSARPLKYFMNPLTPFAVVIALNFRHMAHVLLFIHPNPGVRHD